jgi:thiol:disulfide interchange protein DsbD
VILLFSSQLQVRANPTEFSATVESGHVGYSDSELTKRIDNGEAVFLDVTAAWCITCKANESLVLNSTEIQTAFKEKSVVYMIADWTNYDPTITELLAQYGRNGIPLYLWFNGSPNDSGEILPQVLSKSIILQKLNTL